jgi:hypothetical protein
MCPAAGKAVCAPAHFWALVCVLLLHHVTDSYPSNSSSRMSAFDIEPTNRPLAVPCSYTCRRTFFFFLVLF